MYKEISPETSEALAAMSKAIGGDGSFHVVPTTVCDHCKDETKEAFPYGVHDAQGKYWEHLCNGCYDALGCSYEDYDDFDDDEIDEFEAAMSECGYNPDLGFCTQAGTEFCDWECPLAEIWFNKSE